MSQQPLEWDDRNFKRAIGQYLDLKKNVDPVKELKRRAKNVGMRLIKIYKTKGVNLGDITAKVKSLGPRVKIRPKIRAKKISHEKMIKAELNARRSAKGFTSTGWFPSVQKLGGNPQRQSRPGTGPKRGALVEKLNGSEKSETLVNQQPGAVHVMQKDKSDIQKALDDETADMAKYIARKQNEAARKAGL